MTAAKRLFHLKDVSCRRGGRILFQNVSLRLSEGDLLHVQGPNGTGKTSLLRAMAGILPVMGGIFWECCDVPEKSKRLHFLPAQDHYLKPAETAMQTLHFWAGVNGAGGDKLGAALANVGLSAQAQIPVRRLSAGQRRRLSIARLLLEERPLWLLDEPLNALDTAGVDMLFSLLDRHRESGGIAVIAGHQPVPGAMPLVLS